MAFKIYLFIAFLYLAYSELLQVALLFRHGARYHLHDYYDANLTRYMWGQLSPVGMRQHYNLGTLLRKEYIEAKKLVRPSYNFTQVEVFSTSVNRAIASAISHLYGFFPPGTGPTLPKNITPQLLIPPFKYNDDINETTYALPLGHQVIPISTGGLMEECPTLGKEIDKNVALEHVTLDQMNNRYRPFLDRVARIYNVSVPFNVVNVSDLFDTLACDKYLNRPFPSEFTDADYVNMRHLVYFTYSLKLGKDLGKALTTRKFDKIFGNFDAKTKDTSSLLKWSIFSAHDTQIYPTINILNITSPSCIEQLYRFNKTNALNCEPGVEFASSVIIQLYRDDVLTPSFYVKVKYNGKYVFLCEKKFYECQYNQFKSRVLKYKIDYNSFCAV